MNIEKSLKLAKEWAQKYVDPFHNSVATISFAAGWEARKKEYPEALTEAMKKWITNHTEEEQNEPYLVFDCKTYTLKDLLYEIDNNSEVVQKLYKNLINLTVDLLSRGKISNNL